MDLDATDRALLMLLSEDARVSHRSLARTLGLAQGTVTNRIRRLEDEGVIEGYRVALNPTQLGWSMTIMAGLRIQKGRMIDVQQKISADPRVFAVYDVTGDWDSIVLARVKDLQQRAREEAVLGADAVAVRAAGRPRHDPGRAEHRMCLA